MDYAINTVNLTKAYGKKVAINRVNLNVKKGDIYGLIGKNGAGKTTLIKCIIGLASSDSGEIKIFNETKLGRGRRRIGSSVENPALYPNITAFENLQVYRKSLGITNKDKINEVLKKVGLFDVKDKKAGEFSLGMKQRLAIALALLGSPDMLLLDEPINGLDPMGIIDVRELLLKLNEDEGITIVISSHILGELSKMATCYGIMNNGELVEEFTKSELEEKCKKCLKLNVDSPEKASNILETYFGISKYDVLNDNNILIYEQLNRSGEINFEFAKNNVIVNSMTIEGEDLEGYFMDRMGGMDNDKSN